MPNGSLAELMQTIHACTHQLVHACTTSRWALHPIKQPGDCHSLRNCFNMSDAFSHVFRWCLAVQDELKPQKSVLFNNSYSPLVIPTLTIAKHTIGQH